MGLPASVHLTWQSFYCNFVKWDPIQFRGALRNKLDLNGAQAFDWTSKNPSFIE